MISIEDWTDCHSNVHSSLTLTCLDNDKNLGLTSLIIVFVSQKSSQWTIVVAIVLPYEAMKVVSHKWPYDGWLYQSFWTKTRRMRTRNRRKKSSRRERRRGANEREKTRSKREREKTRTRVGLTVEKRRTTRSFQHTSDDTEVLFSLRVSERKMDRICTKLEGPDVNISCASFLLSFLAHSFFFFPSFYCFLSVLPLFSLSSLFLVSTPFTHRYLYSIFSHILFFRTIPLLGSTHSQSVFQISNACLEHTFRFLVHILSSNLCSLHNFSLCTSSIWYSMPFHFSYSLNISLSLSLLVSYFFSNSFYTHIDIVSSFCFASPTAELVPLQGWKLQFLLNDRT